MLPSELRRRADISHFSEYRTPVFLFFSEYSDIHFCQDSVYHIFCPVSGKGFPVFWHFCENPCIHQEFLSGNWRPTASHPYPASVSVSVWKPEYPFLPCILPQLLLSGSWFLCLRSLRHLPWHLSHGIQVIFCALPWWYLHTSPGTASGLWVSEPFPHNFHLPSASCWCWSHPLSPWRSRPHVSDYLYMPDPVQPG